MSMVAITVGLAVSSPFIAIALAVALRPLWRRK